MDALGFIFYAKSPRHIEPEAARRIIAQLPPLVAAVGVFVNEEMARVAPLVRECGLQYAQLHGGESPEYCRELAARAGCRVLKAIRVGPATKAADIAPYRGAVCGYLLDTYHQDAVGGTGAVFDWALIDRLELDHPFCLPGGLRGQYRPRLAQADPLAWTPTPAWSRRRASRTTTSSSGSWPGAGRRHQLSAPAAGRSGIRGLQFLFVALRLRARLWLARDHHPVQVHARPGTAG